MRLEFSCVDKNHYLKKQSVANLETLTQRASVYVNYLNFYESLEGLY